MCKWALQPWRQGHTKLLPLCTCTGNECIRGSRGTTPLILDLGTRWRCVVKITLHPLWPQRKSSWYSAHQSWPGEKCLTRRQVAILNVCLCQTIPRYFSGYSKLYSYSRGSLASREINNTGSSLNVLFRKDNGKNCVRSTGTAHQGSVKKCENRDYRNVSWLYRVWTVNMWGEGSCNMASHALEMAGQWPK